MTNDVVGYAAQRGWSLPSPATSATFLGILGTLGTKTWIIGLQYLQWLSYILHLFFMGIAQLQRLKNQPSKVPSERDVAVEKPDRRQEDTPETQMASCRKWGSRFLIRNRYHLRCTARNSWWLTVVVTHPPQIQWVSQFPDSLSLEYHNVYLFPSMFIVYHDFIRISQSLLRPNFPRDFFINISQIPIFPRIFPSFPGGSASLDLGGRPVGQCLQPPSSTRAADPSGRGLAAEPCRRHGRYQQHGVDLAVGGGGEPGGADETARWGRFADSQGTWAEDRWTVYFDFWWTGCGWWRLRTLSCGLWMPVVHVELQKLSQRASLSGHHVNAPVQKLFADLDALSPTPGVGLVWASHVQLSNYRVTLQISDTKNSQKICSQYSSHL